MKKAGWNQKCFLIDGFPRNEDNQQGWDEVMSQDVDMKFVLFLDASEEEMIARIEKRAAEMGDQKRSDDNRETLIKRFAVFKEQSMPIVNRYEQTNQVRKINANQDANKVYEDVCTVLSEWIKK